MGSTGKAARNQRYQAVVASRSVDIAALADSVARRIAAKSSGDATTGCVLWHGTTDRWGYGYMTVRGKKIGAHRISYTLVHGAIPKGLSVLHSCDTPACINPAHLRLGTDADNHRDTLERGRHRKANQTHCIHGHAFDEANTYRWKTRRQCRACNKAYSMRKRMATRNQMVLS